MPSRPLVLIIDDLPQNVEVLGEYLSDLYEIQCAFSGPEGLALIAETLPDLILLDVMMPGMDGYAVCDTLKHDRQTRQVPVIFVTAKSDAESETRALAAGAVDFIHKPINRDVVRARVRLQLELKAREQELQALNAELEQRVDDRTLALRDALILAESAYRAKCQFLSNINHELRTPMSAIFAFSDLISYQFNEPKLRERVDKIKGAGRQLLSVVNDIIDMSDLQAQKIQIDSADFILPLMIDSVLDLWREQATAKGLTLALEIDPTLPPNLRGDPARLGQIVGNLLSNAIKFSERGCITLRVRSIGMRENGLVTRFEVEDEGIGIDPKWQTSIFSAFEQVDSSSTRLYGGNGLGLAICKQLVRLMKGDIGLRSVLGEGSLFWIDVPLVINPTRAMQAPIAPEKPPASSIMVETSTEDWNEIRQVFVPLAGLLAAGDIQAYMIWARAGHVIAPILGKHKDEFIQTMEAFDFTAALAILQAVRAAYPQLETFRPDGR